ENAERRFFDLRPPRSLRALRLLFPYFAAACPSTYCRYAFTQSFLIASCACLSDSFFSLQTISCSLSSSLFFASALSSPFAGCGQRLSGSVVPPSDAGISRSSSPVKSSGRLPYRVSASSRCHFATGFADEAKSAPHTCASFTFAALPGV